MSSAQAAWLDPAWEQRVPVAIDNFGGGALIDHQVVLVLDTIFPFTDADSNGDDLRITSDDGVTLLDYWIKNWDSSGNEATVWIEAASVSADALSILYLYFDNALAVPASDGDATFLFFDDFETDPLGYYPLSLPDTSMLQDQPWENRAPHTMSVLERNQLGQQYWGYYGLQGGTGGIGLAFSNDLFNWTKASTPLFTNGRWASVIADGPEIHMMVTKDWLSTSRHIVRRHSPDGITFTEIETVVAPEAGTKNQNPQLFFNDQDGLYYLFWFRFPDGVPVDTYEVWARSATAVEDLDLAPSHLILTSAGDLVAAPHVMFHDGTYFLAVETYENSIWMTRIYASEQILTGYEELPGNPILSNGDACFFQHKFEGTLHAYYCKLTGTTWTLEHRTANLAAGRIAYPNLVDPRKWISLGGSWQRQTSTGPHGQSTKVARGTTSAVETLMARWSGSDYVVETYGRLLAGRVWGLNARVSDPHTLYTSNLYEDLDATNNLYLYRFAPGIGTVTVATSPVGPIHSEDWHEMTLAAHGSSFDVSLDGTSIHSGVDAALASGNAGLYGEANTVAQFDNFRVRKFVAPQPAAILLPEPGFAGAIAWGLALLAGFGARRPHGFEVP